jgi:hypothetical protein
MPSLAHPRNYVFPNSIYVFPNSINFSMVVSRLSAPDLVDNAQREAPPTERAERRSLAAIASALNVIAYPPRMEAPDGIPVRCVPFSNSRDLDSLTAVA